MWLRNVFVLELFLGARVENRNQHVVDLGERYNSEVQRKFSHETR